MKIASRWLIGAGALAGALALPANAYNDLVTHNQLSLISADKSAIRQDPTLLFRLGVSPIHQDLIAAIVGFGAYQEDIGSRSLNHFYDPYFNRTLTIFGVPFGKPSWEWMLGNPGPINGQDRSLVDARAYLNRALTFNYGNPVSTDEKRNIAMSMLFLSLGSAAHHMQDMAQPQHVRNDDHLDKYEMLGLNPLYRPSRYEKYTRDRSDVVVALGQGATPVFPGNTEFKTAKDFWFNSSNTGIAQYTNQKFVSAGTNFTIFRGQPNTGTYPQPVPGASSDISIEELYVDSNESVPDAIRALCGTPAIDCTMTMYSTADSTRASTLSIFDQDLSAKGVYVTYNDGDITPTYSTERLFALNRFNFDNALQQLIGKAVGYSAGIINHFFRGKLEVAPPDSGAYAVVDQSKPGFTTIRAKVTNATPGEALPNGTLTAIARFHRNNCFKPDLSGEFTMTDTGDLVIPCPDYRSVEEHIRVAKPQPQPIAFTVNETKDFTFTFDDPIPLDATDLILQVYYQGTVGEEKETFALGAVDLSEPTFVAIMNATDVFELPTATGGQFFYHTDITNPDNIKILPYSIVDINRDGIYGSPPDVPVIGGDINYGISVDGQKIGDVLLSEGRFARLAVLVKLTGFRLTLTSQGSGFNQTNDHDFAAKQSQVDPASNTFMVSVVTPLRNQTLQFDSVTYFRFYLDNSAPLETMPPSKVDSATMPIAINVAGTQPQMLGPPRTVLQVLPSDFGAGYAGVRMPRNRSLRVQAKQGTSQTAQMAPATPPL